MLGVLPNSDYESDKIDLPTETFWFCTLTGRSKLRIKQENNTRRRGWQRLRVCTRKRALTNW